MDFKIILKMIVHSKPITVEHVEGRGLSQIPINNVRVHV